MTLNSTVTVSAKDNPFATHRVEAVPFCFATGDWESNLQRLRSMNWRGAIVGAQGSGKTTLMLELQSRLANGPNSEIQAHFCFTSRDRTEHSKQLDELIQRSSDGSVLLVDGIERLTWWQRRRLFRHDAGRIRIVVTAHRPTGLPVWIGCQTDWPLMQSILERLIESPNESLINESQRLFQTHRGNIREVLRELYDRWTVECSHHAPP